MHTGLESDSTAILPTLNSYDPRQCAGLSLSFSSLHELLVHAMLLDPLQEHTGLSIISPFLLTWSNVEMLKEEQQFEKAMAAAALDITKGMEMEADDGQSVDSSAPTRSLSSPSAPATAPPTAAQASTSSASPPPASVRPINREADTAGGAGAARMGGALFKEAAAAGMGRTMAVSLIRAITANMLVLITTQHQPLTSEPWFTTQARAKKGGEVKPLTGLMAAGPSTWQRVVFPKHLKPSALLQQVEQSKAVSAALLSSTSSPSSDSAARQSMKCCMSSLQLLTSMLLSILLKNANDTPTTLYARKRFGTLMIQLHTPDVLAATLQWLDLSHHQSNRLGLQLITSAARVLDSLLKLDLLYGLRGEQKRGSAKKDRRRGRRAAARGQPIGRLSAALLREPPQSQAGGEEEVLEGEDEAMVEDVDVRQVDPEDVEVDDDDDQLIELDDGEEDDDEEDMEDVDDDDDPLAHPDEDIDAMGLGDVITVADDENEEEDEEDDEEYGGEEDDEDDEEGDIDGVFDDEDDEDEDEDDDGEEIDVDDDDEDDEAALHEAVDADAHSPNSDRSDSEAENELIEQNQADSIANARDADDDDEDDEAADHRAAAADAEEDDDEADASHEVDLAPADAEVDESDSLDDPDLYGDALPGFDADDLIRRLASSRPSDAADRAAEEDEDDDGAFEPFAVPHTNLYLDDDPPLHPHADADADDAPSGHPRPGLEDFIEVSREEADRMADDLHHIASLTSEAYTSLLGDPAPSARPSAAFPSTSAANRPPSRRTAYRVVRHDGSQASGGAGEETAPPSAPTSAAFPPTELTSMRLRRSPALSNIHAAVDGHVPPAAAEPHNPRQTARRSGATSAASSAAMAGDLLARLDAHRAGVDAALSRLSSRSPAQSPAPFPLPPSDAQAPDQDDELEQERARYLRMAIARDRQQRSAAPPATHPAPPPHLSSAEVAALEDIDRLDRSARAAPAAQRRGGIISTSTSSSLRTSQRPGHIARTRISLNPAPGQGRGAFPNAARLSPHDINRWLALNPAHMSQMHHLLTEVANMHMAGGHAPHRHPHAGASGSRHRPPSSSRPVYLGSSLVIGVSPPHSDGPPGLGDADDPDDDRLANGGSAAGVLMEDEDDSDPNERDALYAGEGGGDAGDDRSDGSEEGDEGRGRGSSSGASRWMPTNPMAMPPGPGWSAAPRRPAQGGEARNVSALLRGGAGSGASMYLQPGLPPLSAAAARRAQRSAAAQASAPLSGRSALIFNLRSDVDAAWLEFDPLTPPQTVLRNQAAAQHTLDPTAFALIHNVLTRSLDIAGTVHIKVRAKKGKELPQAQPGGETTMDTSNTPSVPQPAAASSESQPAAPASSAPPATEAVSAGAEAPPTEVAAPSGAAVTEEDEEEERLLQQAIAMSNSLGSIDATAADTTAAQAPQLPVSVLSQLQTSSAPSTSSTTDSTTTGVSNSALASSSSPSTDSSSASTSASEAASATASASSVPSSTLSASASASASSFSSSSFSSSAAFGPLSPPPPADVDADFLSALPADLRYEVLEQHNSEVAAYHQARLRRRAQRGEVDPAVTAGSTSSSTVPSTSSPASTSPPPSSAPMAVDEDFLAALPLDIRQELLQQHQSSHRQLSTLPNLSSLTSVAARAAARDMDTSTFIQTLEPGTREEALLSCDEDFLFTLPPPLLAEALFLRNRNSSSSQRQPPPGAGGGAGGRSQPTYTAATRRVMNVLGGGAAAQSSLSSSPASASSSTAEPIPSPSAAAASPPPLASSPTSSDAREQPSHGQFPRVDFNSFTSLQRRSAVQDTASAVASSAVNLSEDSAAASSVSSRVWPSAAPASGMDVDFSGSAELLDQRSGHSLLSNLLLVPVLRVLYMIPINEAQISVIQRIAQHLITVEQTRYKLLSLVAAILRTTYLHLALSADSSQTKLHFLAVQQPEVQRMLAALPRGRVLGTPEEIQLGITDGSGDEEERTGDQSSLPPPPPTVVVLRLIDLVRYLISKMPYLVTHFFFKRSPASSFALHVASPVDERKGDADDAAQQSEKEAVSTAVVPSVGASPPGRPPLPPASASSARRRSAQKSRKRVPEGEELTEATPPSKKSKTSATASAFSAVPVTPSSALVATPTSGRVSAHMSVGSVVDGSPLLELFAMFSSPYIVSSSRSVYYLTRMLADLLELPCKHIAEVQAARARKEKKRTQSLTGRPSPPPPSSEEKMDVDEKEQKVDASPGEKKVAWDVDDDSSALLYRDAHFDLPYTLPTLPSWCIRAFLLTLTSDGYTERCMELACKVLLMMAERADNNASIIAEVGLMCVRLSADIERDIRLLIAAELDRIRQSKGQPLQLHSASPPPQLSDSQKKRKRGSSASAASPASPGPTSSSASAAPSPLSSSLMWRLTIREAALLRFIRLLNTLNLIDAPSTSSSASAFSSPPSPSSSPPTTSAVAHSSSTIKLPTSAPAPTVLTPARVESGKDILSQLGVFSKLRSLWQQLDRFFSILENAEEQDLSGPSILSTPVTPSAGGAGGSGRKAEVKGKAEKSGGDKEERKDVGRSVGGKDAAERVKAAEENSAELQAKVKDLLSKKVEDTRLDLVEEGGAGETKESDLLLLMHLPLLEAFFIVCAPRVGEMQTAETAANSAAQTPAMTPAMTPRKSGERETSAPSRVAAAWAADKPPTVPAPLQVSLPRPSFAPSSELQFYYDFASRHRRLLNVCCRQQPSLLKSVTGAFHSLVWHPAKILDFDIRRKYFKSEMKKLAMKQRQANPTSSMASLRLYVRRESMFEDSYAQLERYAVNDWKNKLHVKFYGEEGLDAGGLSREWFLLLSREIFNPQYALFKPVANNPAVFQPNKYSYWNPDHLSYFKFVGRFVGKALHDGQRLDAYFAKHMLTHMLGRSPSFHDLESVDMAYYNNLVWMLQNDIEGVLDDLTFSTESDEFGRLEVVDLIPNGRHTPVTNANKLDFIHRITDFILTRSIQRQIDAFLQGFRELIPPALLIFNEHELELLLCGLPQIDLHDLQAHIEYRGYTAKDQPIQWFWSIAHDMTQQEKALLMLFVTGTSKIPLEGFKALQGANGINPFTIQKAEGADTLPLAHTCFNTLDLPEYSTMDMMRSKLIYAIKEGSQGFGFR